MITSAALVLAISGPALRDVRVRAGLTLATVATNYGVAWQRIQEIERRRDVSEATATRYLDAVEAALAAQQEDSEGS